MLTAKAMPAYSWLLVGFETPHTDSDTDHAEERRKLGRILRVGHWGRSCVRTRGAARCRLNAQASRSLARALANSTWRLTRGSFSRSASALGDVG